jgi:NADH dehydrogenase/putative oxidoreductase
MAEPLLHRWTRSAGLARAIGLWADTFRVLQRSAAPGIDLLIRLWIAQIYFVSGVVKIADWDRALYLSANEYPVSWLDPASAAYAGIAIELIGPLLLACGLATRFAALAMAALALVIQFEYAAFDAQLFWAALLGWFVVFGAGPLSLDRLLARGLADSALPFAAATVQALERLRRFGGPVYQLLLRLWLAAAIVLAAAPAESGASTRLLLPLASGGHYAHAVPILLALLLATGLASRVAAIGLTVAALAMPMAAGGAGDQVWWIMAFALFALHGAGPLSPDALIDRVLRRRFPQLEGKPAFSLDGLPRVVIVGAGFGGLACADALAKARVAVTLIDRHNYHLFQPLLYQVATASLSPGDIATPVRGLFRERFNVRVLLDEVSGVDTRRQEVLLSGRRIPYDYLVLATGAAHSYFGRDEWAPHAPGLKRVEDATEVRRRLLAAFERAEATDDEAERASLLTFLIVGGGPTGVELAGAIAELARFGMEKDFRGFDPATARIVLVQAGPRLLPTFPEALSAATQRSLEKLGVEVLTDSRVEAIDERGVVVSGARIAARTVLWAAGVVASPAARWLGADADNAGRVKVGPDLSVAGLPNVFVVGDTALAHAWKGAPVPGLAPAAKQGGAYVAQMIRARVEGRRPPAPFAYRHLGSLATIGRKAAVADFGWIKLRGALAWWFWGLVHVAFLVDLRSRVSVTFDWFWSYLTLRSGTRLITGGAPSAAAQAQRQELARVAA